MFKFRLESIKRLREYKEKTRRDEVAVCMGHLQTALRKHKETEERIDQLAYEFELLQQGNLSVPEMVLYHDYLKYQKHILLLQKKAVEEKKQDLHQARKRLLEAMKEKKILVKLRDKQYNDYFYSQDKQEQSMLDELAKSH